MPVRSEEYHFFHFHQVENTVRWRPEKDSNGDNMLDENGKAKRQSNARMVRWSDGRSVLRVKAQNMSCFFFSFQILLSTK